MDEKNTGRRPGRPRVAPEERGVTISAVIRPDLLDRLDQRTRELGLSRSALLSRIVEDWLDGVESSPAVIPPDLAQALDSLAQVWDRCRRA